MNLIEININTSIYGDTFIFEVVVRDEVVGQVDGYLLGGMVGDGVGTNGSVELYAWGEGGYANAF